eukprot:TRINITY_DN3901_c0_g1_i1.p1 TRINITY_DN3901_c0_g1~~TRINITY_DN3901_c0_g1_i1.p1  ORF type:complete len:295 (-),score=56.88 TRINITY_DN3901_c0_g1_i1:188-1072(-)
MGDKNKEGFKLFRSWVSLQRVNIDYFGSERVWKYYDWGPKDVPVLVCIPGVSGTAETFYKQFLSLCPKGYRIIAVQPPAYMTHASWTQGFDRFLDLLGLNRIHLLGTSLGGYLALCFLQYRPQRVASLILQNAFCDTSFFQENAPCVQMFSLMPTFMLQRFLLANFPNKLLEREIAASVDFMVEQLETLDQTELASRLTLNCTSGPVNRETQFQFDSSKATFIDTLDEVVLPEKLKEELYQKLPDAKKAFLKTGGNFPFLSRSDEFNIYLIVHLRNQGVVIANNQTEAASSSSS